MFCTCLIGHIIRPDSLNIGPILLIGTLLSHYWKYSQGTLSIHVFLYLHLYLSISLSVSLSLPAFLSPAFVFISSSLSPSLRTEVLSHNAKRTNKNTLFQFQIHTCWIDAIIRPCPRRTGLIITVKGVHLSIFEVAAVFKTTCKEMEKYLFILSKYFKMRNKQLFTRCLYPYICL